MGSRAPTGLFNMMRLALFVTLTLAAANADDCVTQRPSKPGTPCMSKSEVEAVAGAGRFNYLYGDADKCFNYGGRNMCIHTVGQLYGSSCNAQACSVWLGYCEPSDCNSDAPATTDAPPANNGGNNGGSGDSPADSGSMGSHDMSCGTSKFPESICTKSYDTYCPLGSDHTKCQFCDADEPTCGNMCSRQIIDQSERDLIVAKHNELRRRVAKGQENKGVGGGQPSATNMYEMKWNDELASIAQMWADQCIWGHDDNRKMADGSYAGQNGAMGMRSGTFSQRSDFSNWIQSWYDEVEDFPGGNVSHYTQVAWGASKQVGCGYVAIENQASPLYGSYPYTELFYCNYGDDGGNMMGGVMYTPGATASDCPNGDNDGLCTW